MDTILAKEDINIVVENASGLPGIGNYAADSIDMAGGHVFDVVKGEIEMQGCQILVKKEKVDSYLVTWLMDRFNCVIVQNSEEIVIVKIGKEFGETVIDLL